MRGASIYAALVASFMSSAVTQWLRVHASQSFLILKKTIADVDHYLQMIHYQFSYWSIPCIIETPFLSLYLLFFTLCLFLFLASSVFFGGFKTRHPILFSSSCPFYFNNSSIWKFRKRLICQNCSVRTSDLYQIRINFFNSYWKGESSWRYTVLSVRVLIVLRNCWALLTRNGK